MFSYFAGPLMNKLTGLFSASQKRFLRFVLNINLRPYLRNPIQQGELDLQIDTGRVELKDVELNEKSLNKKLGDNSVFTVKSGLVGSIAISVPWNNIRNESIKVTLSNIEIIVVPGKNETFFEEVVAPISIPDEEEEDNMPDHTSDPTLNAMEKMFEGIFNNVEITIHNLSIFIETTSGGRSLYSNFSNMSINQATNSALNSNYLVDVHLGYAKIAKDADGARSIKFRDISVNLDEKPFDGFARSGPSSPVPLDDDVGITPRSKQLHNNVILSYLTSDPTLFDTITYRAGTISTTPTGSPTRLDGSTNIATEVSQKLEIAAKLTNSSLKCNLSLENYNRLMYIIGQFIDPPTSSSPSPSPSTPPSAASPSSPFGTSSTNTSPTKLNTSGLSINSSNLSSSYLSMSNLGMSSMGMSNMGMSNLGASAMGSSILQFSAFFPNATGQNSRLDNAFFSNGNLMDSAIFGTLEESRLEKSILTKYSAFSSWTPTITTQKVLLRVEIRSGSCNFVIPTDNGKTMTTSVAFDGLVVKTKKLKVMQNLELRFSKLSVFADDETSNKPIFECIGSSIRSSLSDPSFKANVSLMHSEETNDTTVTLEVQTRPIYFMYDGAWLDSIKKLVPNSDSNGARPPAKKGKFSFHVKLQATSAHVVVPFPKKESTPYFPSRYGKRNWLLDLYLENLKLTHAAIGNMGNAKTHVFMDSIVSYFGMKYDNDSVKWLDVQRTNASPVVKLVLRTKSPAPNPAHPSFHPQPSYPTHPPTFAPAPAYSSHPSTHSTHSYSNHGYPSAYAPSSPAHPAYASYSAHNRSGLSSSSQMQSQSSSPDAASRFSSPSFVYAGKKIDFKHVDVALMQKASAMVVELVLPPTVIEIAKDDYDILLELIKLFSSDEESPMTHVDISCPNVRLTLHDRKKQRLKKNKYDNSSKTATEVYFNTYRLHIENFDFLCSLSYLTTKSNLFMLRIGELEGTVSDNNCTNQGEKVVQLLQKVTKRKSKHESLLSVVIPSLRVTGEDYQITLCDKICATPNVSMFNCFIDWFSASPPPPASLSTSSSSLNTSSISSSSPSSSPLINSKFSPTKVTPAPTQSQLSSSLASSIKSSSSTMTNSSYKSANSALLTSSGIAPPTHTQIVLPNLVLVHTPVNSGTSQIVVAVDSLTVNITTTSPGNSKITVLLKGPRVFLSLLRNYPNLEPPNLVKYLMENNFREVLTLVPNRNESVSLMEISIKFNDHATKSVVSVDFENRKFELSTLADSFHALKVTFPLFLDDLTEHLFGDDGDQAHVPIVTHAEESGSTITLPQMAAKPGEGAGLAESLLNRSWWGGAPEISQMSNVKKATDRTREILSQGYFVVEHPSNEEERKTFESNLDVLRKTELVLEIEEEVEVDEAQQETKDSNYQMDDSILDSWIVMGTDQQESILNPETVVMICGIHFTWKIDILQKEKGHGSTSSNSGSHVVLLVLDIPIIRFETFPEAWAHRKSMNLRIEFNDIRIEDHLLASAYRNVFTFDAPAAKKGQKTDRTPQNVSVASLTVSTRKGYGGAPHYSAKISLAPVYLGINQRTLDLLLDFFNRSPDSARSTESAAAEPGAASPPVYFDKFQVSALKVVVDYKPRGLEVMDYSKVVAGGYLWLVAMIPLECASFTLSEVDITNTTLDKLPEGVASTWMPNVLQTNIPQYIKGVQPIKIMAKMGSGVIGLVKVPIQEYKKDANILLGVGKGIQTLTFEVLNFGSRVTVSANKILKKTERMISGSPGRQPNEQKISSYANQPSDIREGAVQGMQVLLAALSGAADGIITRPLDEYQKNGKWGFVSTFLRGLPGCVLQPVIGVTGAVSKLTLGLRNTLDSKEKIKADAKYKSTEINNSNNAFTFELENGAGEEGYSSRFANFEVMEDYEDSNTTSNTTTTTFTTNSRRK